MKQWKRNKPVCNYTVYIYTEVNFIAKVYKFSFISWKYFGLTAVKYMINSVLRSAERALASTLLLNNRNLRHSYCSRGERSQAPALLNRPLCS